MDTVSVQRSQRALVLAWGTERETGIARHVTEVERGLACNCLCGACGHPLEAVNPKTTIFLPGQKRPFFRHHRGQEKKRCRILAGRLALQRALLAEQGIFELPARRVVHRLTGQSGKVYEGIAEAPAQRVIVREVRFSDEVLATLLLADGRLVEVVARGRFGQLTSGGIELDGGGIAGFEGRAVIELDIGPELIAGLSADEVRQRLFLQPGALQWCRMSADAALAAAAEADAARQADEALDLNEGDPAVPVEWRRESALHRAVKEIIAAEKQMWLPELNVSIRRQQSGIVKTAEWTEAPKEIVFDDVALEVRLGRVIPDVVARLGEHEVLIEVTVFHDLSDLKRERLAELGLPVLEIDLARYAGQVTREELRRIVLGPSEAKVWAFHPRIERKREELVAQVLDEITQARLAREATLREQAAQKERERAQKLYGDGSACDANRAPLPRIGLPAFNRAPAKTAAQRYAEATGRDAVRFRPSPAESADSPFLAGAELEQWKRTNPDAWKQWVETRPQRARGDGEDEPAAEE